jgi:hypothetical protein
VEQPTKFELVVNIKTPALQPGPAVRNVIVDGEIYAKK